MSKYGGAIIATCSRLPAAATVGILVKVRPGGFTGDASFRHWCLVQPSPRPGTNPLRQEVIGSPAGLLSQRWQSAGPRSQRNGHRGCIRRVADTAVRSAGGKAVEAGDFPFGSVLDERAFGRRSAGPKALCGAIGTTVLRCPTPGCRRRGPGAARSAGEHPHGPGVIDQRPGEPRSLVPAASMC
jgi:hypothetical protein